MVELRKLRTAQPALIGIIELLERYLVDFDKLASVQRIVQVDKEKIVEKNVDRPVLIPILDEQAFRTELASGLLAERLIQELRRLRKENPNLKINLDDDTLIFFNSAQNSVNESDFGNTLTAYTTSALSKLKTSNGTWTNEHEILLSTILKERFALANLLRRSNQ